MIATALYKLIIICMSSLIHLFDSAVSFTLPTLHKNVIKGWIAYAALHRQ